MSEGELVRLSEVRMEGVGVRDGKRWAVRDVSISVRPGELYTLLGPAGAGKSAVLRALAGLSPPDEGRIVVDDEPIDHVPPSERNLGMVFASSALWPHMTVFENVAFGLRARGRPATGIAAAVAAALACVGLAGLESRRPAELEPGEPERVALARALAVKPRLLLLDDPFAQLDPARRLQLRVDLGRLHRDIGITTLLATRDRAAALAVSTRVAVMAGGRIEQEGRPDDVYWRPRTRFVAELVGAANLVPVRVVELRDLGVVVETPRGTRVPVAAGGHQWTAGARALLCLRPEALRVEEAALAPGGLPGTVSAQVFEGSRQLYEVDVDGAVLRVEMLTSATLARGFLPGDHVRVEVAPESSVLLPDEAPASP